MSGDYTDRVAFAFRTKCSYASLCNGLLNGIYLQNIYSAFADITFGLIISKLDI